MKIAQIAPIIERVPPKKYGGTERVVYALTEELVKLGHNVTLFATGDSITSARLVSYAKKGLRELYKNDFYNRNIQILTHLGAAYALQDEFDIIHDHCGIHSVPFAVISHVPILMTLHGAFNKKTNPLYETLNNPFNPSFVSISQSQREGLPTLNYSGTVYNGLPMAHYPFSEKHDDYLLFVGRIAPEKGVHHAITVAKKVNKKLIIAVKLEEVNVSYFKEKIEPYLSDTIRWIGEIDEKTRNKIMSRAYCFLHPTTWNEPFGLTLIESMATGCPVIAIGKGSIPEIISHGKTGFVVNTPFEMAASVQKIDRIDRTMSRGDRLE